MIETDKVNELICKYKINPTQIYILWLLYTEDEKSIEKYIEVFGNFKEDDFKELVDKGLLIWTNRKAESYINKDLVVTLELVEELDKKDPRDAYDELFEMYPAWLVINGKKIPSKTLTFSDEKSIIEAYGKIISKGKFLHKKILALTNKYKEMNDGNAIVKIDKYVTGRLWEEIDKEGDNGIARTSYY